MLDSYSVERSRATAPLFFRAPFPVGVDGAKPRDFQQAGAEFALARNHCLIGDEPGVGKSLQGILISNAIEAKRTLVVCPASLRLNWEKEIGRWANTPNATPYVVSKKKNGVSPTARHVVISYDLLRDPDMIKGITALHWDHVILDECHGIKSSDAKRTKVICAEDMLPRVTGRFTLLSGTILPNTPIECYNAVRLLDHSAIDYMSHEAFRDHYYGEGGGMVRGPHWSEEKQANINELHWSNKVRNQPRHLDELQHRLRSKVMIRRLKAQVLPQLPKKQIHLVRLSITSEMRAALKHPGWAIAEKLYEMDLDGFNAAVPVDGAISTARRLLGEAKAVPVCQYIEDLMDSGIRKLVVSAWHRSVLEVARGRLAKFGLVVVEGSDKARERAVQQFQTDTKTRIILGQTSVIGEGHTLHIAQDVVLMEPDYVPGRVAQMIDRIHRLGQTGSYTLAHLPIVPGQLDERIVATAIEKDKSIHLALDA